MLDHIFKAYDIRGLAPGELDPEFAYAFGRAFVVYTAAKTVVVGRDMRSTTPELADSLIRGLTFQGARVIDVGLVTTPMFYAAVAYTHLADAGVMVTASHNPSKYNGFKLVDGDAMPIGGERIQELKEVMTHALPQAKSIGSVQGAHTANAYLEKLFGLVDLSLYRDRRVVIDAGSGMAGVILPALTNHLHLEVIPLFWELDGTFPHHEANPTKEETLVELKEIVRGKSADLGLAYDGDADRVGFVDETGTTIPADIIAALLVPEMLARHPGRPVLFDVRMSSVVREEVERAGGVPVMTPVGHVFIKKIMREQGACFAAELSGHFYFQDFYGVECSDLAALLAIGMMIRTGKKLSELVAPLRRYFHSGEINFTVSNPAKIIALLAQRFGPQGSVSTIDGLRVDLDGWWFSVRRSNTEALMRLNLEARSREMMEEKRVELAKLISNG